MIILEIFPMLNFTPYYNPLPTLWEVVAKNMFSFWQLLNRKKIYISVAVLSMLLVEHILCVTPGLRVVRLPLGSYHMVNPDTVDVPRY